jgi:hypothetical protein
LIGSRANRDEAQTIRAKDNLMSRDQKPARLKSPKITLSRPAKIRISHQRTRNVIRRGNEEQADRIASGKPVHPKLTRR